MFNVANPTPLNASEPEAIPYRFFSSIRKHPIYYFLLIVTGFIALSAYPFPENIFFNFLTIGMADYLYIRYALKIIIDIFFIVTIFSNLPQKRKNLILAVTLAILWAPGILLGGFAAPFFLLAAFGHYLILRGLQIASERKKYSRLIIAVFCFIGLVGQGLTFLDKSSRNDIRQADKETQDITSQVLSGQLTDPVIVYQKCEKLRKRGASCRYDEFAARTGNATYCEYAGIAMYEGGAPAKDYSAACIAKISNTPTGN